MNEEIQKVSTASPNSRLAINTNEEIDKDLGAEKICKVEFLDVPVNLLLISGLDLQ